MNEDSLEHIKYIIAGVVGAVGGVVMILKNLLWKKPNGNGHNAPSTARELGKVEAQVEEILRQNRVLFQATNDIPRQVNEDRKTCPHIQATKELANTVSKIQQDIVQVKTIMDSRKENRG